MTPWRRFPRLTIVTATSSRCTSCCSGTLLPKARVAIITRRQAALEQSLQRMVAGPVPAGLSELAKLSGQRLVDLAQRQTEAELAWLDEQRHLESSQA